MTPNASDNLLPQVISSKAEKENQNVHVDIEETTSCECQEVRLGLGDALFTSFVVAPQVVSVWRGTWGIMELHPDLFPYPQIYVLGIVIHICFALIRSQLLSRSQNAWGEGRAGRWLRERLLSRVYTYIFILSCIMHWRGGWGLFDALVAAILPDDDPHKPVLIIAICILLYFCLTSLRSSRNLLAPPYFLVTDGKEPTYIFATRFQKKISVTTIIDQNRLLTKERL